MRVSGIVVAVLLWALVLVPAGGVEMEREWTDESGRTTRGTLVGATDNTIQIRGQGDKVYTVPIRKLSLEDQVYIEEWRKEDPLKRGRHAEVNFFGCRAEAEKVVFVVDVSASMRSEGDNGKPRLEILKEELVKAVERLPEGIRFQVLFFSGPAWFLGEDSLREAKNWERKDSGNFWYYRDGKDESLPVGRYLTADEKTVRDAVHDIENVRITGGTDWRSPLKMAIKMEPEVIFFMTDGAVAEEPNRTPLVEDVLAFNEANGAVQINTIALMEPNATEKLVALAAGSGGMCTVVEDDGTVREVTAGEES
ncbi:MAG: hypothetical protein AAF591_05305 [Verrucomicrobiota bacterium]